MAKKTCMSLQRGIYALTHSASSVVEDLSAALSKLECRVAVLEKSPAAVAPAPVASTPYTNVSLAGSELGFSFLNS